MSANHDITRFNIRVYGICIQEDRILITDEVRWGVSMTKFPGGGLEYGEGIEDCLKREWMEELEAEIEVGDVIFANPFFLRSSFNPADQVICFYYQVKLLSEPKGRFSNVPMDFGENQGGDLQAFRWLSLNQLAEDIFTFPSDKAAAIKLMDELSSFAPKKEL